MFADWRFRQGLGKLAQSPVSALQAYAAADWPDRAAPARDAQFVALDFELDGLGKGAHLLQVGWVPFTAAGIDLTGARSFDIRSDKRLDDTAVTIHGIGEQRARAGAPLAEAIEALLADLAGRVIVAHGASIEREALQGAVRKLFGFALPIRSICTLAIERYLSPNLVGSGPYRLGAARVRHGLPPYDAHDALTDALAAAELFLAQLARLPADIRLGTLEGMAVHR
ncbi:exonuclease domain-containing protein [Altererythrobacter sp. H2]|uniref:exonuclease domain-containing protein n=1 Tax=Altererythrobacter sp. H2 TaxID=3108391 RepID=UPI002B4BC211|nr:exonuclease domain-containing protein [Altererythrobacter sp. H2]WRK95095.1 exonuclease domain-containing protein [Altererythrobacter sp. H2]